VYHDTRQRMVTHLNRPAKENTTVRKG
jgi:hypothetical protein